MMQSGKIQQMLLVAAKDAIVAPTAVDAETIAEGFENSYDLQDFPDVRGRPEDEGTVIVDSMTAAEDPPNMAKNGEDAITVMAAACRMLMEVLVGAVEIDFTPMPCIRCQDDETVPKSKQDQRYQESLISIQPLRTILRDPDSCVVTNIKACALMAAASNLLEKHFFNTS